MFNKDLLVRLSLAIVAFSIMFIGTDGFTAIAVGGGSGGGCEAGGSFVTVEAEATCDSERVLTGTANQVIVTDNGADSTVVLSLPQSIATTSDVTFDDVIATRLGIGSVSEFLTLAAPATIRLGGRDNVIIELDSNANSVSDFCIRTHSVATDIFCIDESGNVTLATLDGDLNVFVDIKPDSFDSVDAGADEECLTYEGTNTVEWQPCGSGGGVDLPFGLPIPDGSTPTTTAYIGVPGAIIYSGGAQFVTANDIYYEPFRVTAPDGITIDRLSFEVTSAGNPTDTCRIGIYEADSEGQAGALVDDSGTALNDSTGWKHISDTIVLDPGEYLKAFVCNSGPALYSHNSAGLTQGAVNSGTTSATRGIRARRDSAPTGTPHASGFADPGDSPFDTLDLINIGSEGHFILLRWSLN